MTMRTVICISRTTGAGGETVGHRVAEALGFRYVDEDVIVVASRKAGIDPSAMAKVEERAPLLDRILDALTLESAANLAVGRGAYYVTGGAPAPAPKAPDTQKKAESDQKKTNTDKPKTADQPKEKAACGGPNGCGTKK